VLTYTDERVTNDDVQHRSEDISPQVEEARGVSSASGEI